VRVIVPGKTFLLSLIFASKSGANPIVASLLITRKYHRGLENKPGTNIIYQNQGTLTEGEVQYS
jgi:hypothetical protein